jgi:hypothetical protein
MTNEQYENLCEMILELRSLLMKHVEVTPAAVLASSGFQSQTPIPQPTALVDDPDSVVVHFGKNNGRRLGELGERSIEWYASVKEPKLDRNGRPFAPRASDLALENAARQIIHRRRNTLSAVPTAPAAANSLNDFDSDSEAF